MLNDFTIKAAKPAEKPIKLYDSRGLYLLITPAGGKLWRFKYRFAGKERLLALGKYPDVSLKAARNAQMESLLQLSRRCDPGQTRRQEKREHKNHSLTFETLAQQWLEKQATGVSDTYVQKIAGRLRKHVFPALGQTVVTSLSAPEVLPFLEAIDRTGRQDTARECLKLINQILRYAVGQGVIASNPCTYLAEQLSKRKPVCHRAAAITPEALRSLLIRMDAYQGFLPVMVALRLAPMLAVRPKELRCMEWCEVDLGQAQWSIPATKMKMRESHMVPLPTQAVTLLHQLHSLTGAGQYAFPNGRTPNGERPMSENAVLSALRSLGIGKEETTGHGFRATFRTLGEEVLRFRADLLEQQLAHRVVDPLGRAYNRTQFLDERRQMMQQWADYLDSLRLSASN